MNHSQIEGFDARTHNRVNLRHTHPTLYYSIMVLALTSVALAVNFWTSHPTFNPYNISKNLVGAVFCVLGVYLLVFLHVFRLRQVRLGLAASLSIFLFWGVTNTQQFFSGNASLQLPILYLALAALHYPLLVEPPVNPMTQRAV